MAERRPGHPPSTAGLYRCAERPVNGPDQTILPVIMLKSPKGRRFRRRAIEQTTGDGHGLGSRAPRPVLAVARRRERQAPIWACWFIKGVSPVRQNNTRAQLDPAAYCSRAVGSMGLRFGEEGGTLLVRLGLPCA